MTLPQPLLPFIRGEFNLSNTRSGFVISAFTLTNAFAQLPAGWLADRIGPRILITIGILGVAVLGFFVGISQTYVMMIVFLILMGLAGGGYHPAATPLISASIEPQKRGRALGFHLIGGNASFFLTPIIAGAIAGTWGWRFSFIGLAVPAAVFGAFFYLYMKRQSRIEQYRSKMKEEEEDIRPGRGNLRRMVAFLILTVVGGGVYMSVMAFLPLFAVDNLDLSEQASASLLSIVWSSGLWAGPVGGYISDRIGRIPVIVATGILSSALVYTLNIASWGPWFVIILLFLGIGHTMRMPVSEAFIIENTPAEKRSTIYGFYYFTMAGTGAVFAPILGYIIDTWSYYVCFSVASVVALGVTLVCTPFLLGRRNQAGNSRPE